MKEAFDEVELKIYGLLAEGTPQAIVVKTLKADKSKVSRVAQKLVDGRFLICAVKKGVKIYKKGAEGKLLDDEILKRSLSLCAPSVTPFSPKNAERTALVHHMKYRLKVLKEGDLEKIIEDRNGRRLEHRFLRKKKPLNGMEQWGGQLPYHDQFVTVELQKTAQGAWLYVHAPKVRLTAKEIGANKHEEYGKTVCMDISAFVSRWGGWQLGLPEYCQNWKPHFGFDHPMLEGYADKMFARSQDGSTWLSDSEGATELETDKPHIAQVLVELPGEVIRLKVDMRHIADALLSMAEAVRAAKSLDEEVSASLINVQASLAELQVKLQRDKVPQPEKAGDPAVAALDDGQNPYIR